MFTPVACYSVKVQIHDETNTSYLITSLFFNYFVTSFMKLDSYYIFKNPLFTCSCCRDFFLMIETSRIKSHRGFAPLRYKDRITTTGPSFVYERAIAAIIYGAHA